MRRQKIARRKVAAATQSRLLKPGGIPHHRQQWSTMGCAEWLGPPAMGGGRRFAKLRPEKAVDGCYLALPLNVQHTYDREKKLVEKYDVSSTGTGGGGGEYPLQDGFGWTNGVTLKMLDLVCPKEQPCDSLPASQPVTQHRQPPQAAAAQ
jgi:alpha,alpha-trehalase